MSGLELKDADVMFSHTPGDSTPGGAVGFKDRIARMTPAELSQVVQASMDGWAVFIETGLTSNFYIEARDRVGPERATRVTLMFLYLATFSDHERERLEKDVDYFLFYATGFLRELFLPVPLPLAEDSRANFHRASRLIFIRAMGRIFRRSLNETRRCRQSDAHLFMRTMLTLCASVEGIVDAWDDYKEYMFRFYPQLHSVH